MGKGQIVDKINLCGNLISLPPRDMCYKHITEAYGGLHLLANYVELKQPYYFFKRPTYWQHGWIPDFCKYHPLAVCGEIYAHGKMSKEPTYLVGKSSDEKYLQECGYTNTTAIGLPLVYLPNREIKRIPNTLLVMPVHSLSYTKHAHWNFQAYVDAILSIKNDFDKVVICVHPSCVENGYWVNEFLEAGFDVVEGAYGSDKNSFYRLELLMRSFEYVTTNGFGSHIAYAAYFGARVSIFGNFAEHKSEDYEEMYQGILEDYKKMHIKFCELTSENSLKHFFPFLFYEHPKNAIQRIDWGKYEVGFEAKKTPNEIKRILGWDIWSKVKYFSSYQGIKTALSSYIPTQTKKRIKAIFKV